MKNAQNLAAGTILKHNKQGFTVIFKNMVNENEFRTSKDFQFFLKEFTPLTAEAQATETNNA